MSLSTALNCAKSWISTAARSPTANGAIMRIDFTAQKAVFSIYRRASECALYRIEKNPEAGAQKQGAYRVVGASGLVLKRGQIFAASSRFSTSG